VDEHYSQSGEVKWLLENVKFPKHGYFVDIGANDGVTDSNSYYFEKELGWDGVCVEPDPRVFTALRKNRKCECLFFAVGPHPSARFYLSELPAWSGTTQPVGKYTDTFVAMQRLDKIVGRVKVPIDVLSIDTEGTEVGVLQTLDLNKWLVRTIIVEWNSQSRMNGNYEQEIRDYMVKQPYDCAAKIGANLIYVRKP